MIETVPQSPDAEQSVIGGLLIDNKKYHEVASILTADDFYRSDHRMIFTAIQNLASHGKPFDCLTLEDALKDINKLDKAGGAAYIYEILHNTPSVANIIAYADIVKEKSILRKIVDIADKIREIGMEKLHADLDISERIFMCENIIFKGLPHNNNVNSGVDLKENILKLIHQSEEEKISGNKHIIKTGYGLDLVTGGFHRKDLIVIGARPSMGKTAVGINIASKIAMQGKNVLFFSLEDSADSLTRRFISCNSGINLSKLVNNQISENEYQLMFELYGNMEKGCVKINDTAGLTSSEIISISRNFYAERGCVDLIIIDYLGVIRSKEKNNFSNKNYEIEETMKNLRVLSKEIDCPVIVFSQLNRLLEQRQDKRPMMSDLRDSGAIEQIADVVMFIYRDEVYNPDTQWKGIAEIIVAKNKQYTTGIFYSPFFKEKMKFF